MYNHTPNTLKCDSSISCTFKTDIACDSDIKGVTVEMPIKITPTVSIPQMDLFYATKENIANTGYLLSDGILVYINSGIWTFRILQ